MAASMEQTLDMVTGFFKTKTITSAFQIRIFDELTEEPKTATELSKALNIPAPSLERLLIALNSLDLIEKHGKGYLVSESNRDFLVSTEPKWLGWLSRHIDTFLYPLWGKTADALKEEKHQREAVFKDDRSWFDILYQNPQDIADFQKFLHIFAMPFIDGFIQDVDLSKVKKFVDIGSGKGTLPIAIGKKYPHIKVDTCELPGAGSYLKNYLSEVGMGDQIQVLEGNIIKSPVPGELHDFIHLGWMLHDYSPDLQQNILGHIFDSLTPGGTFAASETPLNDDSAGPAFTALLSINMLVSTDGGVESTCADYISRFEKAGFVDVHVQKISGPRTLIVGKKPIKEQLI